MSDPSSSNCGNQQSQSSTNSGINDPTPFFHIFMENIQAAALSQEPNQATLATAVEPMDTSATQDVSKSIDLGEEPLAKKPLLADQIGANQHQQKKNATNLARILCCGVCWDLPKGEMYECSKGHAMCDNCFSRVLADGRLRNQIAICPNCRCSLSRRTATRNRLIEKLASELSANCEYCEKQFALKDLERHEQQFCEYRPSTCKNALIGCQWKGPFHATVEHEQNCGEINRSGSEIMSAMEPIYAIINESHTILKNLMDLITNQTNCSKNLQMKPFVTRDYDPVVYYKSTSFSAFNHEWMVRARINGNQRHPHKSNERILSYQVILTSVIAAPMRIHFFATKGPYSDIKVSCEIYKHDFTEESTKSDYYIMPLPNSEECNRLLSHKSIDFQLRMFMREI